MKVIFPHCFLPILCWSVSSSSFGMFPNLISEARLGAGSGFGNLTRSGKLQRLLSLSEAQEPGGPTPPPGTKQRSDQRILWGFDDVFNG